MKLRPISDHIVVKLSSEQTSASGIIILEKERSERGEVVAVGPGKAFENGSRSPMEVKVGDIVVFKSYASEEVKDEGSYEKDKFLVVGIDDVTAVIEK